MRATQRTRNHKGQWFVPLIVVFLRRLTTATVRMIDVYGKFDLFVNRVHKFRPHCVQGTRVSHLSNPKISKQLAALIQPSKFSSSIMVFVLVDCCCCRCCCRSRPRRLQKVFESKSLVRFVWDICQRTKRQLLEYYAASKLEHRCRPSCLWLWFIVVIGVGRPHLLSQCFAQRKSLVASRLTSTECME